MIGTLLSGATTNVLLPVLAKSGAGILADIVRGKSPAAAVVVEKIGAALGQPGASPSEIADRFEADPTATAQIIREVERESEEMWKTIAAADQVRDRQFEREHKEHWLAWAWRPGTMYLFWLAWGWQFVALAREIPTVDTGTLLGLTTLYLGLWMGGHTVKSVLQGRR